VGPAKFLVPAWELKTEVLEFVLISLSSVGK
jgi:hypothetical protein